MEQNSNPAQRTILDDADDLRKEWRLTGTGPYAQPAAPAVDAAELGKLKALAEAAKEQRSTLYMAAINCGHAINDDRIILHREKRNDGNALSQLADRLESAVAPLTALVAQQATRIAELEAERDQFKAQADAMTDQIAIMESNMEGK
jgi:hypothetical protein